jgi:exodeoxyribonuclease V beta subunit
MNNPIEFNLLSAPLDGRSLIEASAGTGKTYALAGLFLRFILEKKLSIGEILAVTFTEAAAEELRGRIHSLLRNAKEFLEHPERQEPVHDSFLLTLLSQRDKSKTHEALINALRDFDSCAIFTIHGFCQRLLYEFAFESDQLLSVELITDQSGFVNEIVEDFWRKHFCNASFLFSAYTLGKKISPNGLIGLVDAFVCHEDVRIIPEAAPVDTEEAERNFLNLYKQAAHLWKESRADVAGLLQSPSLDGRKYGKSVLTSLLPSLDLFFTSNAPDPAAFQNFEKVTQRVIEKSVKKGFPPVSHVFFNVCESLDVASRTLCSLFDCRILYLKSFLMLFMHGELDERKRCENVLFFDDLLLQVRRTLSKKNAGSTLVGLIRKKFRAVLIDEFQDTDPLQCGIFFDLFSENTALFLIGDPKQAIYGFRGADIFAYLKASKKVDRTYTLSTNFRSEKRIVSAVNTLFSNRPNPFVFNDIKFRCIAPAGNENNFSLQDNENSRFILWFIERTENKGLEVTPLSKGVAEIQMANSVSSEISKLLNLPNNVNLRFSGKKIFPTEIAVLVRTNREAELIYNTLTHNGIAATIQGNRNVFETIEALDLYRLLFGMTNVLRLDALRAALSTCYIGYNANEINRLNTIQAELDQILSTFAHYLELWKTSGFMRMMRLFIAGEKVRTNLLSMPLGERKLTNFLHLLELIHKEEISKKNVPKNTCKWLLNKILQDSCNKPDEEVLRLEKDENAIRVMTFHKSKGLEFPIVFCPFSWEGSEFIGIRKNSPFLFHDPDDNYLQKIALGEEEINRYKSFAEQEQLAENIRLLYVGLTRAKYCCYCSWGMISKAETSAFAYLLHGTDETPSVQALGARLKGMPDDLLRKEIQKVVDNSGGSIEVKSVPLELSRQIIPSSTQVIEIGLRDFSGAIPEPWQIASFSSITRFRSLEADTIDLIPIDTALSANFNLKKLPQNEDRDIFSFPKGKKVGTFLHDVLEHVDFNNYASMATENIVQRKLNEYGFDFLWSSTINKLINNVMTIPLVHDKGNFALNMINTKECVREMEFMFPIKNISSKQLNDIFSDTSFNQYNFLEKKRGRLDFLTVRGFLKGFIDLIFKHEGRYFIVDWKSNFLGGSIDHYNIQAIREEMAREFYYVQYYIYLIALNEFLSKRLPNYSYNEHFGGIYYIFLRGIDCEKGCKNGIFFDKPDETWVNRLRECLI